MVQTKLKLTTNKLCCEKTTPKMIKMLSFRRFIVVCQRRSSRSISRYTCKCITYSCEKSIHVPFSTEIKSCFASWTRLRIQSQKELSHYYTGGNNSRTLLKPDIIQVSKADPAWHGAILKVIGEFTLFQAVMVQGLRYYKFRIWSLETCDFIYGLSLPQRNQLS